MKEQNAAHSFDKIPWGKQEDIDALNAELTRLRSELQQKDEVINELVEAVEKLLRVDSFRGDFPYTTKVFESVIQKSKAK